MRIVILLALCFSFAHAAENEIQYADFDLAFEGDYAISLSCQAQESAQNASCKKLDIPFHLNVMNTMESISVQLVELEKNGWPTYSLMALRMEEKGAKIQGKGAPTSNHPNTEFSLEFSKANPAAITVTGWVRDPKFRYDLQLSGVRLFPSFVRSPSKPTVPVFPGLVVGNYTGEELEGSGLFVPKVTQLSIRLSHTTERLIATGSYKNAKEAPVVSSDYVQSTIDSERGILTFVGPTLPGSQRRMKYVLFVSESPTGVVQLRGYRFFSDMRGFYSVSLDRKM